MNRAKNLDTSDIWLALLGPPVIPSWGTWDDDSVLVWSAWGGSEPSGNGGCVAAKTVSSYAWDDEPCTSKLNNIICQEGTLGKSHFQKLR